MAMGTRTTHLPVRRVDQRHASGAEHSVNVATGMSIGYGIAVAAVGFLESNGRLGIVRVALFHQAGALYIQHVRNPECF